MKQYFTKTGIELMVIQGEGLGDGIPCGFLKVVAPEDTRQSEIASIHASMKSLYSMTIDHLTLSQYEKVMGGDMSFASKARKIMEVSRNKTVHLYCKEILELDKKLNQLKVA